MLNRKIYVIFYWYCLFLNSEADDKLETFLNINSKKVLNYVSDKFLSISIDPAVLLAGVNLSETSLRLAKHLSPSYIRLAGLSTEFVKYVDEDIPYTQMDTNSVTITPSMWFGINEWLALTNLTPIYGINDEESSNDVWNPKSLLPLLELSDKLNVSCLWQLGFDSTNKSDIRYKQDLNILHHILAAFPERNGTWKIVGSDISHIPENSLQNTVQELEDIVTAVMWESNNINEESFLQRNVPSKLLSGSEVRFWTTAPKSSRSITFDSAYVWGKQAGNAAQRGYDVIFRQPRMHELFTASPVYWFSYLHKQLIGRNVLEAKTSSIAPGISTFAYCSRKQNSFVRRGAITILIINENKEPFKIKVRLGTSLPEKYMEVQEYILTSSGDNSTDIYLNENPLKFENLKENLLPPKVRRTKTSSHVPLLLPPRSIGFFVLPGARIPVCIDQEIETNLILEEIEEDQNAPLLEEIGLTIGTRSLLGRNQMLEDIAHQLKSEMILDQTYYSNPPILQTRLESVKEKPEQILEKNIERGRKFFIDRAKLSQKQKKLNDFDKRKETLRNFLEKNRLERVEMEPKLSSKSKNIELTSGEVESILKERARARAAQRNIIFTDEELNALIHKASKKFFNSRIKRSIFESIPREKRHINMKLLERKQNSFKKSYNMHNIESGAETHKLRFVRKPRDLNKKSLNRKSKFENSKMKLTNKREELLGNAKTAQKNIKNKIETLKAKHSRFRRDIISNVKQNFLSRKSKLEESRMRLTDKREELLGNARVAQENIKNRIENLKAKHRERLRRDINMDLLKIKSEGQKKKVQPNESHVIKKYEEKTATIRKPGQTSDELFEELKEAMGSVEEVQTPVKTDVFAKLADSEEDIEEEPVETNPRPRKLKLFDKKSKIDPFAIVNPQVEVVEPTNKRKKSKANKPKADDDLQFLTASAEFTDVEEGLPCIHEFFGNMENSKKKKSYYMHELGEFSSEERGKKHKKQKKMFDSTEGSNEKLEFRRKREMNNNEQGITLVTGYPTLGNLIVSKDASLNKKPHMVEVNSKEYYSISSDNLSIEPLNKTENKGKKEGKQNNRETILEVVSKDINNDQKHNKDHTSIIAISHLEPNRSQHDINSSSTETPDLTHIYEFESNKNSEDVTTKNLPKHNEREIEIIEIVPAGKSGNNETDLRSEEILKNITSFRNNETENAIMRNHALSAEEKTDEFIKKYSLQGKAPFVADDKTDEVTKKGFSSKDIEENSINETQEDMESHENQEENETTSTLMPTILHDLHELGHIVEKPEDPRLKRERLHSAETKHDIKNDIKSYQKDVKQHFKDILARDKMKFEEEKKKNRQKLLQLKKQQEEFLTQDPDNILTKIHNEELARRQELLEQINVMKKKLQKRKNEIDAMLIKDIHHQEEENEEIIKEINKNTLGKLSKDIGKTLHLEQNTELTVPRTKRSLFEPMRFGNYQPLTLNLKSWKPADVLSLKRDQFLGSNSLAAPNDYHIFKNIFDQNRRYGYIRRRRNIENGRNSLENEVDGYLKMPNTFNYGRGYAIDKQYQEKMSNEPKLIDNGGHVIENKFSKEHNVEKNEVERQFDSIMNLRKDIDKNKTLEKNISNSTGKGETAVLKRILTTLTEFLKNLGKQLGSYVSGITPT